MLPRHGTVAGERPEPAHGRAAPRGDPDRDPRGRGARRAGGDARLRRGDRARREPGAGLLPLPDQGRPGRRGVRARGGAGLSPASRRSRPARTRRSTGCAGCCGSTARPGPATGWQLWIDAWALAQREPRSRVMRRMDQRWCAVLREVVEAGVASRRLPLPGPAGRGHPHLGAARRAVGGDAGLPQRHPRPAAPLGGGAAGGRARRGRRHAGLIPDAPADRRAGSPDSDMPPPY